MSESTLLRGLSAAVLRPRSGSLTQPTALRRWAALLSAALGGLLLDAAAPGLAWWPLVFPGIMLVLLAIWQQRVRFGALAGLVAGGGFWLPHISWLTLYLGPVPWLALCGVMLAWFALFGLAASAATRALALWWSGSDAPDWLRRRPRAAPLVLAAAQAATVTGLWVLREQVQGSWPYDGFAWGRVATVVSDSPSAQSVSWVGFAGLTALLVLACASPVAVAMTGALQVRRVAMPAALGGSLALIIAMSLVPAAPLAHTGSLRVAAVQGNSKSAIFDDRESGSVIRDHLDATTRLVDDLEARGETVDVIVWPENSAEFEVREHTQNARRIERLAARAGAPIVIGSVLRDSTVDGDVFTNSSLVWGADGATGARYDKRYPVPFAEYMPNRDFFHALVPDLVDLVQLDYAAGTRPAVFGIDTARGPVLAGIAICFDIIFDEQAEAMVDGDAEIIFAQTNNADFGRTDESAQQLAIARLRAVETGRALVNISTVGTSAIVLPSGESIAALEPHTQGAMVAEVPLVTGSTPALRFGAAVAGFWMLIGGLGLIVPVTARIAEAATPKP